MTCTVTVATPGGTYPIVIGPGLLASLATHVPVDATALALVSNPVIMAHYGRQVRDALAPTGKRLVTIELPDGEAHKTWESLNRIFDVLLQERLDRKAVIVALGGGVIGDMAGFAAACFMRGIRFIQVPTTLLAQVDSSVGGKTAINHPSGKNMIGAFHQPVSVVIDTNVLATLPAREVSAGLAEVIKYGAIVDADFFAWCEQNVQALRALNPETMAYAIRRSCELKAHIVSLDERESGVRALLNFGHTFGHAIESGMGYGQWLHGEAVGCGMVMAAELSARVHGLPRHDVERIRQLVQAIGCPVEPPNLGAGRWVDLMQGDKKAEGGQMRFVVLTALGEARAQAVDAGALAQVLALAEPAAA